MPTESSPGADGQQFFLQPLFDCWAEIVRQTCDQAQGLASGKVTPWDVEALRKRWLETLSQSLDRYMRSPAFLEAMRRNFEMLTQMKDSMEDWGRDVARTTGLPRTEDVSGLFERLRIGQEAILSRLGSIEHRLVRLEERAVGGRRKQAAEPAAVREQVDEL